MYMRLGHDLAFIVLLSQAIAIYEKIRYAFPKRTCTAKLLRKAGILVDTRNFYQPLLPFDDLDEAKQVTGISPNAEGIKIQVKVIDGGHWRRPIEFHCWVYGDKAKSGLSQRGLEQTIEREEVYVDAGQQKRKLLVRAQAYDERHIFQQLCKYGAEIELIDPPELRERMRQEVARMYRFYQK